VITPRGTALFWVYEPIPSTWQRLGGPATGVLHDGVIQELDIATGKKVFEWRAHEHIGLDESYAPLPQGSSAHLPYDYLHPNAVGLAADGNILAVARHTVGLLQDRPQDRQDHWRLGRQEVRLPDRPTTRSSSPGSTTSGNGATARTASSTTVSASPAPARPATTRAGLVMRLDEDKRTVAFGAEFVHPDKLSAPTQGNFRELSDGGSFIGWGQKPYFTEHAADGTVRLAGHLRWTTSHTGRTRRNGPASRSISPRWACVPRATR
jgi:hypothetical protein